MKCSVLVRFDGEVTDGGIDSEDGWDGRGSSC